MRLKKPQNTYTPELDLDLMALKCPCIVILTYLYIGFKLFKNQHPDLLGYAFT